MQEVLKTLLKIETEMLSVVNQPKRIKHHINNNMKAVTCIEDII